MDQNRNYNGMQNQQQSVASNNNIILRKPYVKITEEPASKSLRFRYECEGRSAGSIPGVNSTPEIKTFPSIEIVGYKGRAIVVVSCVTKDQPYRPHPHNLVGKEGCKNGICTLEINSETMRAVFSNLGIQCVKKKDIETALRVRKEMNVDPFKTGFDHANQPSSINLNSVRLCFQVFLEGEQKGRFTQPLRPVVSEPIYDKKAMSDLVICRLCSCSASVLGNTQIILLCEKVSKEDISVRFYEENNGKTIWEANGDFQHSDVHKQTAISFKTPRYRRTDITAPAKVFIQLKRQSDGVTSEPLPFEYIPLESDPDYLKRKRQKTNGDPQHLLSQEQKYHCPDNRQSNITCWNISGIKTEPKDTSPQAFGHYHVPPDLTTSPKPLPHVNTNTYTKNPSPSYNIAPALQGNQQIISPNQQYNTNNLGQHPMDMGDYNAISQQVQQQQQQQYIENNFGSTGTYHWETKFVLPATGHGQENCTNGIGSNWNLANNQYNHLQQQQQYQQHTSQNNTINNAAVVVPNDNNESNSNNNEHGLSNLLTIDSEQLVRINSEDQQMLQLNSLDLRISNLSIPT